MTGLLLLGVIGIWLVVIVFAMTRLARLFKTLWIRNVVVALASVLMFFLPVADELITAPQFNKLCEEGTKLKFDPEKIRGKTMFLADDPQPDITIGLLRGYYIPRRYLDVTTKEELVVYNIYHVKGGIFIRLLGISERNAPLTIRSYCGQFGRATEASFLTRFDLKYMEHGVLK